MNGILTQTARWCIVIFGIFYSLTGGAVQIPEQCWQEAGKRYNVDPKLLYVIAGQESNYKIDAVNHNRNGTYDVGIMQINSIWLPELAQYGIREQDLYDPCININIGAWVLSQAIAQYGNTWRAVGAYNAGTKQTDTAERNRLRYAWRIYHRWHRSADRVQQ